MNEKFMDTIINHIHKLLKVCVVTLFVLLVLNVWFAILDRYFLKYQIDWTESMARYLMVWSVFLSVPIIIARRENISLTFLQDRLSPKLATLLLLGVNSLSTAFYGVVAYFGFYFAETGNASISAFFGMPMTIAYYAIPVSFLFMTVVSLFVSVKDIQKVITLW